MRAAVVAFVGALVYRFPELLEVLQEHLEDQAGEVLPHVFMGDVTRWLVRRFLAAGRNDATLREILSFMEGAFKSDREEVKELLAVSFLENLPCFGESGFEIRSVIGPTMQEELARLG